MVTKYPAAIDTVFTLKPILDGQPVTGGSVEQLRVAIIAIEEELGVKPSGLYATVRARFDALENIVGNLRVIELENDLGGTLEHPQVIGIHGRPISTVPPAPGDVYVWDGLAWTPGTQPANVHFAGDLQGNPVTQEVIGINTIPVRKGHQGEFNNDAGKYLQAKESFQGPAGIIFDGTDLWVSNGGSNGVLRINPATPEITKIVELPLSNNSGLLTSDDTHIFVTSLGYNQVGPASFPYGHIFIIERATNNIVGRISTGSTGEFFLDIAVDGNNIYVSTGPSTSTPLNNSRVEKYSKSAALLAYPNSVPPLQTLGPDASGSYYGNMCFGGGFLFVTSGGYDGGKIYKIDPSSMTVLDSYTEDSPGLGVAYGCTFAFGSLWVNNFHESSGGIHRFDPSNLSAPIAFIPTANPSVGRCIISDDSTIWQTNNGSVAYRISTTLGSEAVIASVSHSPYGFGMPAFDGTYIWTLSTGGYAGGMDAISTGLGTEAWVKFFGGQLEIVYTSIPSSTNQLQFQNNGTGIGAFGTINIPSGGTFSSGAFDTVNLNIDAGTLPPPGNVYDNLRLVPDQLFITPVGLWFDSATYDLWVTNASTPTVQKLNVTSGSPVLSNNVGLSGSFQGWKITGDSTNVYVTSNNSGKVYVINKNSAAVVGVGNSKGTETGQTTAITTTGNADYLWVVCKARGPVSDPQPDVVQRFSISDMIANYPTEIDPDLFQIIPNGTADWEDMCFIGGEGGYLVTGSAGYIYQFCSVDDGLSTIFGNYGNGSGYTPGYQLGGVVPVHHNSFGWGLWTTSLGSQLLQEFEFQNLNSGANGLLSLGGFAGDIISDGNNDGDIWINDSNNTVFRVSTAITSSPSITATIKIPTSGLSGAPFMGMAYDSYNNYTWVANPGGNSIVSIDNSSNQFNESWAGPFSAKWFQGDIVFDDVIGRSNLVSTKLNQSDVSPAFSGQLNFAEQTNPYLSPGTGNNYAVILSGLNNKSQGEYDVILGGFSNLIYDTSGLGGPPTFSFIGGGGNNTIYSTGTPGRKWNVIVGGEGHSIGDTTGGTISGGHGHAIVTADYATIAGGIGNDVSNSSGAVISGGANNNNSASYAVISGGQFNQVLSGANDASIGGGSNNTVTQPYGTIAGGSSNRTQDHFDTVGGGTNNVISGGDGYSVIAGGINNSISAGKGTIGGGYQNSVTADYGTVPGGHGGKAIRTGQLSHAGGYLGSPGDAQFARYFVKGTSFNEAPITLRDEFSGELFLEPGQAYAMRVTCIANSINNEQAAMFSRQILVHNVNGTAIIDDQFVIHDVPNGTVWDFSISASDNIIRFNFRGDATNIISVMATAEWFEVPGFTGG